MVGYVLLRLRAHRLLLAAALLTVLLTTSVLAALAGFTSSVGDAGVRRTLATTDAAGTPLLLHRSLGYQDRAKADAEARAVAARAFPGLPTAIRSLAQSDPYSLPTPGAGNDPDVTVLGSLDRSRLRLVSGSWPGAAEPGGPVPVAVPSTVAARFGSDGAAVRPGTELTLKDRVGGGPLRILITGSYRPADSTDRYWQLDPLAGKGSSGSAAGSTYGPLLVDDGSFGSGAVPEYQASWQLVPDFSTLGSDRLGPLADANRAAVARLSGAQGASSGFTGSTLLPDLLTQLRGSLVVARSTLLVGVLQLTLLALMTLLLAARLLVEEREDENALLRARGAAPARLARLAALEAVLLVLPALLLSPLLAGPLIRLLGSYGPLASAGVRLDGPLPASAWWAALAAACGSALVVVGPTLVRARSWSEQKRRRTRRATLPGVLRGGADLALVALAAAAYWQLAHGSGSGALSQDSQGRLGVDPVLVVAPTLALCAGTVLALRLLPPAARLAERLSARGRGLPAALVGWQVARRPQQGAGPVLVLALAAAIGTLALGQSATWQRSQADQTAFNTGGDIRVVSGGGPSFGQGGGYSALPGVASVVPVGRQSVSLSGDRLGELIALDTRTEGGRYPLRPDLAGPDAAALLAPLADPPRPAAALGIALPGRPHRLTLDVSAALTALPGAAPRMSTPTDDLTVELTDRFGLPSPDTEFDLPTDGRTHRLSIDLDALAGGGVPAYPLTLSRITLSTPVSDAGPVTQVFTVHAVQADGATAAFPSGLAWAAQADPGQPESAVAADGTPVVPRYRPGRVTGTGGDATAPLTLTLDSGQFDARYGSGAPTPEAVVRPAQADQPLPPLNGVADRRFLESSGAKVGDIVPLPSGQGTVRVRIAAVVTALPGTGAAAEQGLGSSALVRSSGYGSTDPAAYGGALLVDLAAYDRRAEQANATLLSPSEWWLNTGSDPAAARVSAVLRARPGVQAVFDRARITSALRQDPLGTGPEAALLAAVALAVVLASVGFGAAAAGAVRRRAGEIAVLRALGAPRRLIARSTAAELALPVLIGVGVGLALGEVLTRLVVPLLVLTPQGTQPVPGVRVLLPGGQLCLLLAAIAAVPLLVAAVAGLRGGDPAQRLRRPEET
ncbi:FtsX-like permease family protein [Streptacidiphilus sp. N1-12]|uniref:FtsX-like permease family protein n=2 Tax=Streptacidiphilus alkalitolerans TaxID=3342712 RepID=A0ABV6WJK6_9ACTN